MSGRLAPSTRAAGGEDADRDGDGVTIRRELTEAPRGAADPGAADIALDVRGLRRGAEIRDVSFSVRKGEILGLAGLTGAGRTEVARAIFGADPKDGGEIRVHGRPVTINSPKDAVAAGIGYLPEDRTPFGLAAGMNVRDDIAMASMDRFAGLAGVAKSGDLAAAARRFISRLGVRPPSDGREARLRSGENQHAKWRPRDCDILIFDEPTRGVEIGAKPEIYKLLEDLSAQGKAIIVISSEPPEVMRLSHRIAVMCEGAITGVLPGGRVVTQDDIMYYATRSSAPPRAMAATGWRRRPRPG